MLLLHYSLHLYSIADPPRFARENKVKEVVTVLWNNVLASRSGAESFNPLQLGLRPHNPFHPTPLIRLYSTSFFQRHRIPTPARLVSYSGRLCEEDLLADVVFKSRSLNIPLG